MADDKKDKNNETKQTGPVAELHVPQIITALHQNAVSKCKSQLGSKLRLVNSAIDDSGDKSVLMSTGQHIISVIPTEAAAKADADVSKADAVKVLQTYIQWFIGPDFAKEVNDKTVKSLSEAPDVNSNDEKSKEKLDEHIKPFMTFSQFLREAKTADVDPTDFGDNEPEKSNDDGSPVDFGDNEPEKPKPEDDSIIPDFDKAERKHDPNKKPDEDEKDIDDKNDEDDASSTELGYYVTYDLKVEGMKNKAKIDDSMTSMRKSIFNYLKNFFDNVKFTASGLFGGGDSFTVKDVKDKLRETFGPIDPDELVRNVQERIEKKFKGSTPSATVSVQDQRTLISDLGTFINGKQKQQIQTADYSLFIKIDQDDPKKPIFNRGLVADIVQASIKGMFKKFKNRITKDDVIFIPNYRDVHGNTEKLRALYNAVPTPNQLKTEINRASNVNDAVSKIEQRLDKLRRNSLYKECDRADKCVNLWYKFYKDNNLKSRTDELSKMIRGTDAFNEFFKKFIEQYAKTFDKTKDKNLDESKAFVFNTSTLKRDILQMMFESYLYEDDEKLNNTDDKTSDQPKDAKKKENVKIDAKKLVSRCLNLINKHEVFDEQLSTSQLMCMTKNDIKKKLADFDLSSFDSDFGELKNGIVICQNTTLLSESLFSDGNLKKCIMDILFEDDKPSITPEKVIDVNKVYEALKRALADFGMADIAKKVFTYKLKSLDSNDSEQNKSKDKESKDVDHAEDSKKSNENIEDSKDNGEEEEDTTQFGLDDELNEAEKSKKKKKPPIDDSIVDKIQKNLVEAVRRVLKGGKKGPHQNPLVGFGEKKDVISFLSSHGFGDAGQYKKLKKRYAMIAYIKRPSDGPVLNLKTKKSTKRTGTIGQKNANASSMKTAFQSIADEFNGKIGDVIEFNGVPSNSKINSTLFSVDEDRPLFYNSSDVIANASVYCTGFDIDESSNPDPQPPPGPEPDPNPQPPDPGPGPTPSNKKSNVAYVLPFGNDDQVVPPPQPSPPDASEDNDSNVDVDNDEEERNDLYIIPMPGLKYEDPEFANQNLM